MLDECSLTCDMVVSQYLLFESYPVVFGPEGHNFNPGVQGLMFLPVLGGGVVGSLLVGLRCL